MTLDTNSVRRYAWFVDKQYNYKLILRKINNRDELSDRSRSKDGEALSESVIGEWHHSVCFPKTEGGPKLEGTRNGDRDRKSEDGRFCPPPIISKVSQVGFGFSALVKPGTFDRDFRKDASGPGNGFLGV